MIYTVAWVIYLFILFINLFAYFLWITDDKEDFEIFGDSNVEPNTIDLVKTYTFEVRFKINVFLCLWFKILLAIFPMLNISIKVKILKH